ncbi:hypothetical protein, partial [Shinella sumterensis]|uniref:hypothetical protein n=1 Tax=Shinella sumterensis TaxID=1967501 RepID=UPI003F84D223
PVEAVEHGLEVPAKLAVAIRAEAEVSTAAAAAARMHSLPVVAGAGVARSPRSWVARPALNPAKAPIPLRYRTQSPSDPRRCPPSASWVLAAVVAAEAINQLDRPVAAARSYWKGQIFRLFIPFSSAAQGAEPAETFLGEEVRAATAH